MDRPVVVPARARGVRATSRLRPRDRRSAGRGPGSHHQGRVSRPRWRLHSLSHEAGGRSVRRRPADADTVRHDLYIQHHPGSPNRHRLVDRGPVLRDDAYRPLPGWRPDLSCDAVRLLHQGDARGLRRDLRLSALGPAGKPAEPAARPALSVQQPAAHPGLAHIVLSGRRIPAGPNQIGRVEPRRLSRRGAGPLRDVSLADQRPRRHLRVDGVRGRVDPDAKLVRAFAHL